MQGLGKPKKAAADKHAEAQYKAFDSKRREERKLALDDLNAEVAKLPRPSSKKK
jgi:hypothetical protein